VKIITANIKYERYLKLRKKINKILKILNYYMLADMGISI